MKQSILLSLLFLSFNISAQRLTNNMLDSNNADKQDWVEYQSDQGLIKVGDTLILGKPNGKNADTYLYMYPYSYSNMMANALLGVPPIPLNSRNIEGKEFVISRILTKGNKRNRIVIIEFATGKGWGVINYITSLNAREGLRLGEIIIKGYMSREQAIAKLKEYKELLDLDLMSKEEYEKHKSELSLIIMK